MVVDVKNIKQCFIFYIKISSELRSGGVRRDWSDRHLPNPGDPGKYYLLKYISLHLFTLSSDNLFCVICSKVFPLSSLRIKLIE